MNNTLVIITSGIAEYLLFASAIAATLIITAWGIIKLGRIQEPVYHHMIWLCTLFAVFALPAIWLYAPKVPVPVLPARTRFDISLTQHVSIPVAFKPGENRSRLGLPSVSEVSDSSREIPQDQPDAISIKNVLILLWSVGFLFMLLRLFVGLYQIYRIVRSAEPVSDDIVLKVMTPGRLKLLLTPEVDNPLCFGIIKPVILLPKRLYADGMPEDLRMVLYHELAHIERRDCLVNILQRLIEALLFFHPLVWYASFQLTQQREILCDHHVIAKGVSPTEYVRMLARIVEQGFEKKNRHAVALLEGKLLSRVKALLESGDVVRLKPSPVAIIAGGMVLILCMACGAIRLEARTDITTIQKDSGLALSNNQTETSLPLKKDIVLSEEGPIYGGSFIKSNISGEVQTLKFTESEDVPLPGPEKQNTTRQASGKEVSPIKGDGSDWEELVERSRELLEKKSYSEAEDAAKKAVKIAKAITGYEKQGLAIAISLHNLAGLYKAQGRYEEAESFYREASDIYI